MLESLKKLLLYGGLEKTEYEALKPDILSDNRQNLFLYSAILFGVILMSLVISLITGEFYSAGLFTHILILSITGLELLLLRSKNSFSDRLVPPLSLLFIATAFAYAGYVSVRTPDKQTVTGLVMLVMLPTLLTDRPLRMTIETTLFTAMFVALSLIFKEPDVRGMDATNAILFGTVAILSALGIQRVRIRGLHRERQVRYLSDHDVLTGLRNRNCFEHMLEKCELSGEPLPVCIYADANGLHKINNTRGHRAGDLMLVEVAKALKTAFGNDTYRIGGDEFVAMVPPQSGDTVELRITEVTQSLRARGIVVSLGYAKAGDGESVNTLIRNAEQAMYRAKREYYASAGVDRRGR